MPIELIQMTTKSAISIINKRPGRRVEENGRHFELPEVP